jgi:four helix bundle protein
MSSASFESLRVWHDARQLVSRIYGVTRDASFSQDFALRDQIRRAAISVMSNIAEGHERGGRKEFARFLSIARGSCGEIRSQLYAAEDIGHIEPEMAAALRGETARLSRRIVALAESVQPARGR